MCGAILLIVAKVARAFNVPPKTMTYVPFGSLDKISPSFG